jgi:hypothetical protein
MCFSYMRWLPWYAGYEVMTLLVMLMRCIATLLVALRYICLWMAFFCKNAIWSSLVSRMPLMFNLGPYDYILLNLCLEPCSFHLGSKILLSSWMFSLHAILWRSVRHGYPWVPTDQAHDRPRQVGPAYQKTCRLVSGPNRPSWQPNLLKTF